jgi:molybdopterin synthase catalytic subunit
MANPVSEVSLTEKELELPSGNLDSSAGAIVDFWGVVRALEDGREIDGIQYEAHRMMAEHQLQLIARQAAADFALKLIVVRHRVGFVRVAEPSLFLRVAGRNRAEAFEASQWIVDELKRRVPIWKRPKFKIDNRPAEEGEQRRMHTGVASRRGRRLQLRR